MELEEEQGISLALRPSQGSSSTKQEDSKEIRANSPPFKRLGSSSSTRGLDKRGSGERKHYPLAMSQWWESQLRGCSVHASALTLQAWGEI